MHCLFSRDYLLFQSIPDLRRNCVLRNSRHVVCVFCLRSILYTHERGCHGDFLYLYGLSALRKQHHSDGLRSIHHEDHALFPGNSHDAYHDDLLHVHEYGRAGAHLYRDSGSGSGNLLDVLSGDSRDDHHTVHHDVRDHESEHVL